MFRLGSDLESLAEAKTECPESSATCDGAPESKVRATKALIQAPPPFESLSTSRARCRIPTSLARRLGLPNKCTIC